MIEYFAAHMWQAWAIAAALCLTLELTSGDFFFCCFAIGAAGAAVAAPFTGVWVQLAVFAVVSVASLFWVRPVALRYLHKGEDGRLSNADALTGRSGMVSQAIQAGGYGRVAIDGDDWKAKSADGEAIGLGERVRVTALESTIITVERITHTN